jgi:hypothetical protein
VALPGLGGGARAFSVDGCAGSNGKIKQGEYESEFHQNCEVNFDAIGLRGKNVERSGKFIKYPVHSTAVLGIHH